MLATSTALFWPSTTENQPVPHSTDPVFNDLIAYSIFSLYRNTKTIHSIMMIWLDNFIESNYKLASGPPKDPGGVKNIFSRSRGH